LQLPPFICVEQIVLLVTKAVGDLLGVSGIADEAIRFNGYPFLEKDDHVYDIPGMSLGQLAVGT
jgi:chloride channel 3/4/5